MKKKENSPPTLEDIRTQYGDEAHTLAHTLIFAFSSVGKGKNDRALNEYLAEAVEEGKIRFHQDTSTLRYQDKSGTDHALGEENDPLTAILIQWALYMHRHTPGTLTQKVRRKFVPAYAMENSFKQLGAGILSVIVGIGE